MITEQERIKEIFRLDCENQHMKYYQEGYKESMLTLIHGEDIVWDKLQIDASRYAPGGARRVSYDEGWNCAVRDYKL